LVAGLPAFGVSALGVVGMSAVSSLIALRRHAGVHYRWFTHAHKVRAIGANIPGALVWYALYRWQLWADDAITTGGLRLRFFPDATHAQAPSLMRQDLGHQRTEWGTHIWGATAVSALTAVAFPRGLVRGDVTVDECVVRV
jgi:hypothetical protein